MDVGNVGTQDHAVQAAARRESPPSAPPVGANGQGADPKGAERAASSPVKDTVTLSGEGAKQAGPAARIDQGAQAETRSRDAGAVGQQLPALNPNLRADYTVNEGGDLVVKIIDQKNDQVVRQIPGEEQQRIREAITKAAQEQAAPPAKTQTPADAAKGNETAQTVPGEPNNRPEPAPILGADDEKNPPAETQGIGSQTKVAAPETQYAGQARTAEGQETGAPKNGAASPTAQEGTNAFRGDAPAVETSGAVQRQRETGNTPDNGDSGAESQSEARNGTYREAMIASQVAARSHPGQVVDVTG